MAEKQPQGIVPPTNLAEIAVFLRDLGERMFVCGCAMEYYGGFGEMGAHGREMLGAAGLALDWADWIEGKAKV